MIERSASTALDDSDNVKGEDGLGVATELTNKTLTHT